MILLRSRQTGDTGHYVKHDAFILLQARTRTCSYIPAKVHRPPQKPPTRAPRIDRIARCQSTSCFEKCRASCRHLSIRELVLRTLPRSDPISFLFLFVSTCTHGYLQPAAPANHPNTHLILSRFVSVQQIYCQISRVQGNKENTECSFFFLIPHVMPATRNTLRMYMYNNFRVCFGEQGGVFPIR